MPVQFNLSGTKDWWMGCSGITCTARCCHWRFGPHFTSSFCDGIERQMNLSCYWLMQEMI
jgi:hypothetical protein